MTFETFWDEDYLLLEKEFLNFIKYVPLTSEHYDVWSMKLANLLLLIGSSIDYFLKMHYRTLCQFFYLNIIRIITDNIIVELVIYIGITECWKTIKLIWVFSVMFFKSFIT